MSSAEVAMMTNVVSAEIRKIQEQAKAERIAERERARQIEKKRDELLAKELNAVSRTVYRRPGPIKRTLNRIDTVWAIGWAMLFGAADAVIDFGLRYGLLAIDNDDCEVEE